MRQVLIISLCLIQLFPVSAADWYCDPVNGSTPKNASDTTKGNGSATKPWGTLGTVCAAKLINGADQTKGKVHAGDTIKLLTGNHGVVVMTGAEYLSTEPITVIAEERHEPVVTRLVAGSPIKNWLFQGLSYQNQGKVIAYQKIVQLQGEAITIANCKFYATLEPWTWTDEELTAQCPHYGLFISGAKNIWVKDCYFTALENCIHIDCDGGRVEGNVCEYFLSDGITHTSSNLVISKNKITDQYNIDANPYHHDGMQGWCVPGRTNRNVTISDNFVAFSTGRYKTIPPRSKLDRNDPDAFQGVSCFSGPWENFVVERNVVMGASYHGISLYACKNSAIRNNTVIDQGNGDVWIGFFYSTDGMSNIIKDNIAPKFNSREAVRMENNFAFKKGWQPWNETAVLIDPKKTFKLYDLDNARFDLSVLPDSPAAGKEVITVTRTPTAGAVK